MPEELDLRGIQNSGGSQMWTFELCLTVAIWAITDVGLSPGVAWTTDDTWKSCALISGSCCGPLQDFLHFLAWAMVCSIFCRLMIGLLCNLMQPSRMRSSLLLLIGIGWLLAGVFCFVLLSLGGRNVWSPVNNCEDSNGRMDKLGKGTTIILWVIWGSAFWSASLEKRARIWPWGVRLFKEAIGQLEPSDISSHNQPNQTPTTITDRVPVIGPAMQQITQSTWFRRVNPTFFRNPTELPTTTTTTSVITPSNTEMSSARLPCPIEPGPAEAVLDDKTGSDKTCIICYADESCTVFIPCRHGGACKECCKQLMKQPAARRLCPLCRQPLSQILEIVGEEGEYVQAAPITVEPDTPI